MRVLNLYYLFIYINVNTLRKNALKYVICTVSMYHVVIVLCVVTFHIRYGITNKLTIHAIIFTHLTIRTHVRTYVRALPVTA